MSAKTGKIKFYAGIVLLALLTFVLAGCANESRRLVSEGDRRYAAGDSYGAVRLYSQALKADPKNKIAREKHDRLKAQLEQQSQQAMGLLALLLSFLFVIWFFFRYLPGKSQVGTWLACRFGSVTGIFSWREAEELKPEMQKTVELLLQKRIYSYLKPISKILFEFMQLRDLFLARQMRCKCLDRIESEECDRLERLAGEIKSEKNAAEIRESAAKFRIKIAQQREKIRRFGEDFVQQRKALLAYLIDLRTRLDLEETFDGRSELNRLTRQIAGLKKTFVAAEKAWE